MDLNEIAVFTRVAQAGSFTKAARDLAMPVSTVSRKVSDLEKRLGITLIQRTTRKLSLTQAGIRYVEKCAELLRGLEEVEGQIIQEKSLPEGLLRISVPVGLGNAGFIAFLAGFMDAHPQVKVDLLMSNNYVDLVAENVDLAIRFGDLDDSSLIARKLGRSPSILTASPSYLRKQGTPSRPEDLRGHQCLLYSGEVDAATWELFKDRRRQVVRVKGRASASEMSALCHLAIRGQGIALLPRMYADHEIRSGRLVPVLSDWTIPFADAHAVYPSRRYMPARLAAFLKVLDDWTDAPWE